MISSDSTRRDDVIIGIDAGTSVIKAVAFDFLGRQIGQAATPNDYQVQGSAATQNMERTWSACASTLQQLAQSIPSLAERTAAMAVTGQGDGTWRVDASGAPVGDAWLWLDARAAGIVDRFRRTDADTVRFGASTTGLAACHQGPQLLAMQQIDPTELARTAIAFHCKDWLYYRLTGELCTDLSEGCLSFGNPRTARYDDTVIDALGLSGLRYLLPPMLDGTREYHRLNSSAASVCGFKVGTPVILGCIDVVCTAMGAGVFAPDAARAQAPDTARAQAPDTAKTHDAQPGCTILGSTGIHMRAVPTEQLVLNQERTGFTCLLPVPGLAAQIQSNMAATLNLDWILSVAAQLATELGVPHAPADLIERMDGWLLASQPGNCLYHPYISSAGERGPFVDASARAGFIGLDSTHRFADLVRAVVEGLGLAAVDCYRAMGKLPAEIRLSGGATRSAPLRAIMAACLNRPVRTSDRGEAGATGAAMMAAVSIGVFGSMSDCVAAWVAPELGPAEAPDAALADRYRALYPPYREAREALPPIWRHMLQTAEYSSGERS